MIDTHCHLTYPDLAPIEQEIMDEAQKAGVTGMITISTTTEDCLTGLELASRRDNVWCTAGVHPLYADRIPRQYENLYKVASDPKCVAWGEIGLDNHYKTPPADLQRAILRDQINLITHWDAQGGRRLPVVLHCREAFDDLIPLLEDSGIDPGRFVFHCFTGGVREAKLVIDFGAMLSFTGVLTYPNAPDVREAASIVPLDRVMVETDAPFLSPAPFRGKRPCRPAWVRLVLEELALVRNQPFDEVHAQVNANTTRFFGVPTG